MSFIVPKKPQILYAPMLSSFGGGSARGFNPGGGGGLFDFGSARFNPGAAVGKDGPSLSQAIAGLSNVTQDDSWKNNTSYFNNDSGIQLFTVPVDGSYTIRAVGAQGGSAGPNRSVKGGYGASIQGTFDLLKGTVLKILVGQGGRSINTSSDDSDAANSGGGGGSFVWIGSSPTYPLVAAGGGGGSSRGEPFTTNMNATAGTETNGNYGTKPDGTSGSVAGGTGGNRPNISSPTSNQRAGVGAGWLSGGLRVAHTQCPYTVQDGAGPLSSDKGKGGLGGGGNSGSIQDPDREGGFGGGGGASGACNTQGSGGGGGYNGGSVGEDCCSSLGGGGGSYNGGSSQSNVAAANGNSGGSGITANDGFVILTLQ